MNDSFFKNHIDYFLLLFLFAIPPVFNTGQSSYTAVAPVLGVLLQIAVCVYIIFKYKMQKRSLKRFSVFALAVAFAMLMINGLGWNYVAGLFGSTGSEIDKIMPEGILETIYSVFCLAVAALYEELFFRLFLPDETASLFHSGAFRIPCELFIILLFAFGHRYLGLWAVINAFLAGLILRVSYVKSGSFLSCFAAHFIYNAIIFFVL